MKIDKIFLNGEEYIIGGDFIDTRSDQYSYGKKTFISVPSTNGTMEDGDDLINKMYFDTKQQEIETQQISTFIENNISPQTNTSFGMLKMFVHGDVLYLSSTETSAYEGEIIEPEIKITITGNHTNMNLRNYYNNNRIENPDGREITFTLSSNSFIGQVNEETYALETGEWASNTKIKLINHGRIIGKGGNGGQITPKTNGYTTTRGGNGGTAINLSHNLEIENKGTISGGGGGGSALGLIIQDYADHQGDIQRNIVAQGGGGQGFAIGEPSQIPTAMHTLHGTNGDMYGSGGHGGRGVIHLFDGRVVTVFGGDGGQYGTDGERGYTIPSYTNIITSQGGKKGDQIHKNNNNLLYSGVQPIGEVK